VLTAFLLGSGRTWVDAAVELRPPDQARRLRRTLEHMANAVGGYVAGALLIALIAGFSGYVVLTILGVPFRGALALIIGLFSLIPLIGATIAAVIVGVVTLFNDFPTVTIVWAVWAIVYQQVENHLIQPQIQKRTVNVHPFVVLVSVLFGATLLGVVGAIIAIPAAASIQIVMREYFDFRRLGLKRPPPEPPAEQPAPAPAG
jgi:predicted PurR-regulated permease PerM